MSYANVFCAATFDGGSLARVSLPSGVALDGSVPFTLQALVRIGAGGADAHVVRQGDVLSLRYSGDGPLFFRSGMGTFTGSVQEGELTEGGWNDLCVTYDGSMLRIFVNGALVIASACSRTAAACADPIVVGDGLVGSVRWVRTFSRALSADEVAEAMALDFDEVRASPVGSSLTSFADFTRAVPTERVGGAAVELESGAAVRQFDTGLRLTGGACAAVSNEPEANPAGGGNDAYTVQAWVMLDPIDGKDVYTVFANGDPAGEAGMSLYIAAAGGTWRLKALRGDEPPVVADSVAIAPHVWTNVCVTYDGLSAQRLYVDGALAAGPVSSLPMSEVLDTPLLRIGAEPDLATDNARDGFEGAIGRVDVWSRCLGDDEVRAYAGAAPAPDANGLVFSCDFSSGATDNLVSSNPVGLRCGAVVDVEGFETGAAPAGECVAAVSFGDGLAACPLTPEQVAAERRRVLSLPGMEGLPFAENAGMDTGGGTDRDGAPGDRMGRRAAVCVASCVHGGGAVHFLVHYRDASYVVETLEGDVDPVLEWWIEFLLTLVCGAISLLTGVSTQGTSLASLIRANPTVTLRLRPFLAGRFTARTIIGILYSLKGAGILSDMVRAALKGVSWFKVALAVARIGLMAVAFCTGTAVIYYTAMLADLAISLGTLIARYPSEAPAPGVALACVAFRFSPADKAGYQKGDVTASADLADGDFRAVKAPEWTPTASAPVLYALSLVASGRVVVKADFTAETSEIASSGATVRARDTSSVQVLGTSDELTLSFTDRRADGVLVRFRSHRISSVAARDVELTWERKTQDGWKAFATSKHRVYVTVDVPGQGWGPSEPVWAGALDVACAWASGTTTSDAAAKMVTDKVNGGIGFTYDIDRGAPRYMKWRRGTPIWYLLRNLLEEIARGRRPVVNCSDCAGAVSFLSSALGCPLGTVIMWHPAGFTYVPILPVGQSRWAAGRFSFHHVAYEVDDGNLQDEEHTLAYDACCTINGSDDPASATGRVPVLPVKMPFSLLPPGQEPPVQTLPKNSYREHFATNDQDGIGSCRLRDADAPLVPVKQLAPLEGGHSQSRAGAAGMALADRAEGLLRGIRAARRPEREGAGASVQVLRAAPLVPVACGTWRAVERTALAGLRGSCCTRYAGPAGAEARVSVRVCASAAEAEELMACALAACSGADAGFETGGVLGDVAARSTAHCAFVRANVAVEAVLTAYPEGAGLQLDGTDIDGLARAVDAALVEVL